MPFCPNCRNEYRPGFARCTECDVELVESLPEEEPQDLPETDTELVELATFPNSAEAEMIQELLEGNGIRTVLRGDVDPIGVVSGANPSTLLVEQADLPEARTIYEDYFAGDVEGEVEQGEDDEDEESDPEKP